MTLSVDNLPNDINELKHIIIALVQENQTQQQELLAQQQELQAQLEELNLYRRKLFGRSAEPHPPQGEVFNEAEAEAPAGVDVFSDDDACKPEACGADTDLPQEDAEGRSAPRKPQKRRPRLPADLPREEVIIRLPPEEQVCDCCHQPMHCLLYTSPSPRDGLLSRMPSSA